MNCKLISPHIPFIRRMDEWLTPAFPDWFKNLPSTKDKFDYDAMSFEKNVKTCPSFVRLFKNSYLFRAPEDVMFSSPEKGSKVITAAGEAPYPFQSVSSSDMNKKMNPAFSETHANILFTYQFKLVADEPTELVFLDPCYHLDRKSELMTMTGTMQLNPDLYMPIGLNMMLPYTAFDDKHECFIRRGQPLAYFYFPNGKPTIDPVECTKDEWDLEYGYYRTVFQGDWTQEMHKVVTKERESSY